MGVGRIAASAGLLLLLAMGSAQANLALTFTGGATGTAAGSLVYGWSFTVDTDPIRVETLLIFDYGGDGLITAHDVAIWNDITGVQVVPTATVPGGTGGTAVTDLNGEVWREVDIPDVLLDPGQYVIGGLWPDQEPDDIAMDSTTATTMSGIAYQQARLDGGPTLVRPVLDFSFWDDAIFGPNFTATVVPQGVPEPATLSLLALGAISAVCRRRKGKRGGAR